MNQFPVRPIAHSGKFSDNHCKTARRGPGLIGARYFTSPSPQHWGDNHFELGHNADNIA